MAAVHRFLADDKLCLVRYSGEMSGRDFIDADSSIFKATVGANIRFLFDLRDTRVVGGAQSAREYAGWMAEFDVALSHPGARQAIVVSDPESTGISMLMAAVAEPGVEIEVCSTVERACEFLEIDAALLEPHRDIVGV